MEATAIALTAAAHAQASVATIAPLDDDEFWPPHVRVIMTTIFLLLTVMGVVGNLMVITVVLRVPGMITPTNCYLTSLAVSDCLFFVATAPTELSLLHSAEYIFGPIGCAVFSYLPYLAINTSSLSITAFTIERFIGICYPLRARYICTISRAKLILVVIWVFCLLYNSPWLYLATVTGKDGMRMCSFKLDRDSWAYKLLFLNDFATFYLIPMCLYLVIYAKITLTLTNCALGGKEKSSGRKLPGSNEQATLKKMNSIPSDGFPLPASPPGHPIVAKKSLSSCPSVDYGRRSFVHGGRKGSSRTKVQVQIIKMLAVVVLIFAVCWLPYRLMVMYNSFASVRFDPGWYIFFAKTLVFFNCAINPVLYNAMSARFRNAFRQLLRGKKGAKEVNRGHCTVLTEQPSIRAEDMRPFLPANGGMPTSSTIEKL
ncbi:Thyroliberin receptor [Aphelenchoides fujianensis]|nr:Thyroliberin receptor [Aphelenchoides fujianensis]